MQQFLQNAKGVCVCRGIGQQRDFIIHSSLFVKKRQQQHEHSIDKKTKQKV